MRRLTNKNMGFTFGRMNGKTIFNKIYHKLCKLEDIEEEIKIPLVALFSIYKKLCEQKFVYFKIEHQIKCFEYNHYLIDLKNKEIVCMEYEPAEWLPFKYYGITWALSREMLENETSI